MAGAKKTENLTPLSDMLYIERRTVTLADSTLVDPNNALCLYDGEWLVIVNGKCLRASNIASLGNANTTAVAYLNRSGRGRTDTQSLPDRGVDLVTGGPKTEWNTTIFDAAVTIGSGAPITADAQGLKIATISLSSPTGTRYFSGLVGHGGSGDNNPVVARVTKLPAVNGGQLGFRLVL